MKGIVTKNDGIFTFNLNKSDSNEQRLISSDGYDFYFEGINLDCYTDNELSGLFVFNDISAIKKVHGTYSFVFYNKNDGTYHIGNDLLSKQSLFYYIDSQKFCFSTSFFDLVGLLKKYDIPLSYNNEAIMHLAQYGVFKLSETYYSEIQFLMPYQLIKINKADMDIIVEELQTPSIVHGLSTDDIIDKIEYLFYAGARQQVAYNAIKKSDERQYITLSGGMDSRMTLVAVLKAMNELSISDTQLVSITYAQKKSYDEVIAKELAQKVNIKNYFYDISNAEFILHRERNIKENEGMMYYCGTTGAYDAVNKYMHQKHRILHTGLGGGEIMGDIITTDGDSLKGEYYSTRNIEANINDIRTCLNFQKTTNNLCAAMSPFLYEDFFEFMLSLPAELKLNRKIYQLWYEKNVNIDLPTTYYHGRIGSGRTSRIFSAVYSRMKWMFKFKDKYDMNPFFYWEKTNDAVKQFIQSTYKTDKSILANDISPDMTNMLDEKFKENVISRLRVLTITGTLLELKKI